MKLRQYYFELLFCQNKNENENENGILELLYFEFKQYFVLFLYMYHKYEKSNKRLINMIENNKNNECVLDNIIFSNKFFVNT